MYYNLNIDALQYRIDNAVAANEKVDLTNVLDICIAYARDTEYEILFEQAAQIDQLFTLTDVLQAIKDYRELQRQRNEHLHELSQKHLAEYSDELAVCRSCTNV